MEGKGCRDGDKRAATEKTVQAARAQVRSPVSAWLYRVCRVPSICRDCRDARWRDLKARLHHVGQSDVPRRLILSSSPPPLFPSSLSLSSHRLVPPRVASRFGSDENDDPHDDDDDDDNDDDDDCQRPTTCSVVVVTAVIVCDVDTVVVAV